jgi:hypothetical protein
MNFSHIDKKKKNGSSVVVLPANVYTMILKKNGTTSDKLTAGFMESMKIRNKA